MSCAPCAGLVRKEARPSCARPLVYLGQLSRVSLSRVARLRLGGRQARFVNLDSYANAFELAGVSPHLDDSTSSLGWVCPQLRTNDTSARQGGAAPAAQIPSLVPSAVVCWCRFLGSRINGMVPGVFERKYELDTLCK